MVLVEALGWKHQQEVKAVQAPLFVELTEEEQVLFILFSKEGKLH